MAKYIHFIRDKTTGFLSSGGSAPTFSKGGGKIWINSGAMQNHLALMSDADVLLYYGNAELVNVDIEAAGDTQDMKEMILRRHRKDKLTEMHGSEFTGFVDKLYEGGLIAIYPWIIHVYTTTYKNRDSVIDTIMAQIKMFGIKKADYRRGGATFAFRNANDAAKVRLTIQGDAFAYNGETLTEVKKI